MVPPLGLSDEALYKECVSKLVASALINSKTASVTRFTIAFPDFVQREIIQVSNIWFFIFYDILKKRCFVLEKSN